MYTTSHKQSTSAVNVSNITHINIPHPVTHNIITHSLTHMHAHAHTHIHSYWTTWIRKAITKVTVLINMAFKNSDTISHKSQQLQWGMAKKVCRLQFASTVALCQSYDSTITVFSSSSMIFSCAKHWFIPKLYNRMMGRRQWALLNNNSINNNDNNAWTFFGWVTCSHAEQEKQRREKVWVSNSWVTRARLLEPTMNMMKVKIQDKLKQPLGGALKKKQ